MSTILNTAELEAQLGQLGELKGIIFEECPCGCDACDQGVLPGHFACSASPDWVLKLEAAGRASRHYEDGRWRWLAAD